MAPRTLYWLDATWLCDMVTVMNLEEIKVTDMAAPQQTQLVKQIMIYRRIVDTTIQRIEGWWAQLRNSVTDWWIHLFKVWLNLHACSLRVQ